MNISDARCLFLADCLSLSLRLCGFYAIPSPSPNVPTDFLIRMLRDTYLEHDYCFRVAVV